MAGFTKHTKEIKVRDYLSISPSLYIYRKYKDSPLKELNYIVTMSDNVPTKFSLIGKSFLLDFDNPYEL